MSRASKGNVLGVSWRWADMGRMPGASHNGRGGMGYLELAGRELGAFI